MMINPNPSDALPILPARPSVQAKIRCTKTNNTAFGCSNLAARDRFQALANNHALLTNVQANQVNQPPWAAAMEARLNRRIQGVEDRIQGVQNRIQDVHNDLNRVVDTITALPARVSDLVHKNRTISR